MLSRRYRAFISYSHADKGWGDWLHKALETYAIPKRLVGRQTAAGTLPRRFAPVFRDRDELPSATDLGSKVNEALALSGALVVICSPRSAASHWVNEEVREFKRLGGGERVFCLIVDGEPNASDIPGREAEECFAPALRHHVDAEGRFTGERTEPIAADARAGKDGKANAKLKLLSGLLDVGFDELRQRDIQRRHRRMAAITALAVLMMTITSMLAVQAVIARKAADVARDAAERRQEQSEDLVGYMLGDLNEKLSEVGRLDIMQGVADKAMAYFAALPSADVTDTGLAQRATALQKIGGIRLDQGDSSAAAKAYQAAAKIDAELSQRAPADAVRKAGYGLSLTYVGTAYWYQGDLQNAGLAFETASKTLQEAALARPDDVDLAANLAYARTNLGRVLESRGRYDDARAQYRIVLDIYKKLTAQQPGVTKWQEELGYANNNLGKLAYEHGDLGQAIERYSADQKIKAALLASDQNNQQWRGQLAVSDSILAFALTQVGALQPGMEHALAAVENGTRLVALDPDNATDKNYLALYRIGYADLLRLQGKTAEARDQVDESTSTMNALIAMDPKHADWYPDLAKAELQAAYVAQASGLPDAARRHAAAVLAVVQPLLPDNAGDRSLSMLEARSTCLMGDLAAASHDSDRARAYWRSASERIAPLAGTSGHPEVLGLWAGIQLRLGEPKAAMPVIARLQDMGYRNPDFVALLQREDIAYPPNVEFQQSIESQVLRPAPAAMD